MLALPMMGTRRPTPRYLPFTPTSWQSPELTASFDTQAQVSTQAQPFSVVVNAAAVGGIWNYELVAEATLTEVFGTSPSPFVDLELRIGYIPVSGAAAIIDGPVFGATRNTVGTTELTLSGSYTRSGYLWALVIQATVIVGCRNQAGHFTTGLASVTAAGGINWQEQ